MRREKTSIDGRLGRGRSRFPRGPLYEPHRFSPERLARLRRQRRQRRYVHLFVVALVGCLSLVVVPLRGSAHLGAHHFAAIYVPPAQAPLQASTAATQPAQTPSAADAQYLRAPLALNGASQASRATGLPIAARDASVPPHPAQDTAAAIAAATPPAGAIPAAATPGPDGTVPSPTPPAAATKTATAEPTPAIDTPVSPNEVATPVPTPPPDRHDPLQIDARYASADQARPLYYDHVVQPGDTVSTIAARYGISSDTVLWNNPLISDKDALFIGQTLRVPATDGVLYHVHLGDTVSDIADSYSVDNSAIVSLAQNGLASPDAIREGQTILVVGGKPPAPPPPPAAPAPTPTPEPAQAPQPPAATASPAAAAPPAPSPTKPPAPAPATTWIWPATGLITSYFGPAHPLGIDIGQSFGQPIVAARAGTVTFAGGDPCCSYGYYVDIDHGGGWSSRYGHFRSWPIVQVGQHVSQGQVIGYAGSTGYSTGPHLHFEIHLNGVVVNPLGYLP